MYLIDEQYEVQRTVDRKGTSSYYTSRDGLAVIRDFLQDVDEDHRRGIIMDPFAGSGVMLSAINDLVRPRRVVAIEINEGPCMLARRVLSSLYSDAEVICGDAFRVAWRYRADIVITNPPFVRWHLVRNRDELLRIMDSMGYGDLIIRRDPGLHVLSFFLIDHILNDGGYAILVMPASTFYTRQGEGVKRLLKLRYEVIGLVENRVNPSFSDGSGFKELIIFIRKIGELSSSTDDLSRVSWIYHYDGNLRKVGAVDLRGLLAFADRNWLSLFDYDRAMRLILVMENAMSRGLMRYLSRHEVVRGVEMYGPDFFFIPNKYWRIAEEERDYVVITNNDEQLELPRRYLVPCLRRPEYYEGEVLIRNPGFYVLAIGDEPSGDVLRYVRWGEGVRVPALRFGSKWYRHVWAQLRSKAPFGHVFIHDKVDLTRHRVIANYSDKPLCASKNFYIIRTNNPMIAAWYNSAIFREVLAVFGRKISESWTRLLEEDYLGLPVPSRSMGIDSWDIDSMNKVINEYLGLASRN
ncbi:DNA methyltransferase family protein [Vulcanisaeta sp. JCM 14467]